MATVMGAPNVVRGGSHSGNVAASELADSGLLDMLSSDYVPASLLLGALMLAERGAASGAGVGGLPGAIRLVTRNPAQALGLHDRGEIAAGKRADLIRVAKAGDTPVVRGVWRGGERKA
jgi:alpha-D-ribose 1-methylphosphonate 5-triphosphate diphosphatase